MVDSVIEIKNIGKKYTIGKLTDTSFRNSLSHIFKPKSIALASFWALRNVSFNVQKGEVIGIIGKNGAGKSTLLKILSQITKPSEGTIEINGRVASLLEVGTGFHPELTGRENVFLNGTILGMTRKEVKAKFDEILEFSGVEKFIDTPVKHYSSGMYVRLAFAVAAHLDPEILIIDEVLAVGDAEFQKKCLGKMKDVAQQGRTVLFVSHNMNAVNSLCSSCVYIKDGKLQSQGSTAKIISTYLNSSEINTYSVSYNENEMPGDELVRVSSIDIINKRQEALKKITIHEPFGIKVSYQIIKGSQYNPLVNIHFHTSKGEFAFVTADSCKDEVGKLDGEYQSTVWIPENLLNVGFYSIDVAVSTVSPVVVHTCLKSVLGIEVIEDVNLRENEYKQEIPGVVRPKLKWETIKI
jgi:lipopolysaccharide transport system ATP-binding protein